MADVSKIAANGIEYDVTDLAAGAEIQDANADITELRADLTADEAVIADLQSEMDTAQGNISALQSADTSLQTQINALKSTSGGGYCKFADGTLIRWGVCSNNDFSFANNVLNTTVSWTDGMNFTSASSYRVFLTPGRNCIAYLTSPPCESQTNGNQSTRAVNSFEISAKGTSNSVSISWLAVGRWK